MTGDELDTMGRALFPPRHLRPPWWRRDGRWLAPLGLAAGAALILAYAAPGEDHRDTATSDRPPCPAEDELPVRLLEDAYDWAAGTVLCVHIDEVAP